MRLWAGNVVFLEAAEGLRSALRLLGVAARVDVGVEACPWVFDDELWVLVGATLVPGVAPSEAPWPPPRRFVVYQMEQLGSAWLTPAYLALVARADALWEFAPSPHARRWAAAARAVAYAPRRRTSGRRRRRRRRRRRTCSSTAAATRGAPRCGTRAPLLAPWGSVDFRPDLASGVPRATVPEKAPRGGREIVLNAHFYEGAALETHRLNYLFGAARDAARRATLSTPTSTATSDAPRLNYARGACVLSLRGLRRAACLRARGPRAPRGRRRAARRPPPPRRSRPSSRASPPGPTSR
ncbi:hypothetical protein SO694_00040233 [Aureococcus anophagefferens]|uniref:Uncharacterized protein n=1 Tax=Aureococcus anophagefferens TaxID=44056 RepID=A0ABR1G6J3_AURAN